MTNPRLTRTVLGRLARTISTFTIAILTIAAAAGATATAQKPGPRVPRVVADSKLARDLETITTRAAALGFTGSVLAARKGEILFAGGVGLADPKQQLANDANTLFELASATKQFTGAAVCRLVEMKRLKLDDGIAEHLPGIPADCAKITIRHLLQHTSGIPRSNSRGGGTDLAAALKSFLAGGPKHTPGSHWEYWNQGYALLSEIIARAGKRDYVTFCRQQLFAKARMQTACFTGDPAPRGLTVAIGHSERGDRSALEHPYGSYGFQYRGMGGAVVNVWDLWAWDRALCGQKVLRKASKRALFEPGLGDYALGWHVRGKGQSLVQFHGGAVRGFGCELRRYPGVDGCLFVLCNRDDFIVKRLAGLLEDAMFGRPFALPPGTISATDRAALAGSYVDARGVRLTVTVAGEVVRAEIDWAPIAPGKSTHALIGRGEGDDTVLYEWRTATPLKLEREGDGPVTRIQLRSQKFVRGG
jgi:CubicO group peptidase (beta-lactamase class C family)